MTKWVIRVTQQRDKYNLSVQDVCDRLERYGFNTTENQIWNQYWHWCLTHKNKSAMSWFALHEYEVYNCIEIIYEK